MTSHNGAHVQGGKGHIDHWLGMPANMQGVWEMPLKTFVGPASVVSWIISSHGLTSILRAILSAKVKLTVKVAICGVRRFCLSTW